MLLKNSLSKISGKFSLKTSIFWFWITLIVWMLGIGGSDLYLLPALIGIILLFRKTILKEEPIIFSLKSFNPLLVKSLYFFFIVIVLVKTLLSLYSFRWDIFDVGSYSNVVFNLSNGLNYNSFLQIPATADHFTPSLALFVPFYWIGATVHWLTFAKAFSYLSIPVVVYFWLKEKVSINFQFELCCIFGLWMLMIYRPAVRSFFFEFSPSSLGPPFIILSFFLMEKKRWFLFFLTMLFLIGLKEHMGIILLGFGLYGIAQRNLRLGIILTVIGFLVTYVFIFNLMPYFRGYQPFGNTIIEPFFDIPGKGFYLIKLLWPLGFLPLLYWRFGILAAPAIGVNLLSGRPSMYSSWYHYDDISSTLLMIACSLIIIERHSTILVWMEEKWFKGVFIIWLVFLIALLPASPVRELRNALPNSLHINLLEDIWAFEKDWPDASLALQSSIGPHIHRQDVTIMTQQGSGECKAPLIRGVIVEFILLSQSVDHYMINDFEDCIQSLNDNPRYKVVKKYQNLLVYQKMN